MKISEFTKKIDTLFTIQQAEDFDNVGLLCGNPDREITGVLVGHDALEAVIDEAIDKKCNFVICFHPIIFRGMKKITGSNYVEKAVLKAIENKIAIYAVHTALDNDYFGVNEGICKALGIENSKILMPKKKSLHQIQFFVPKSHTETVKDAVFQLDAGKIGFYDQCSFSVEGMGSFRPLEGSHPFLGNTHTRELVTEDMVTMVCENHKTKAVIEAMKSAHPYEEVAHQIITLENENPFVGLGKYGDLPQALPVEDFLQKIKDVFQLKMIRHSHFSNKTIRRVAVLGGSGADGIHTAMSKKCDAYLTADLKYHDFFQPEGQMLLCDLGHLESEQFVVSQIIARLSEKFANFAILKSEVNTNPVNYF